MTTVRRHAALFVAVAMTACAGGTEWTGTVIDSAGVQIVQNTTEGIWAPGEGWTLEEELRIGAVEGRPEYQFGQVGFIAVGSRGQVYVIDAQAREIREFDRDGRYVRTIGSPGSGPGEIGQQAVFLLRAAGDTLIVPDLSNQRINRYGPDGDPLPSTPIDLANGLPLVFASTLAGHIAMQVRPLSLPNRPAPDTLDRILALSSDGTIGDTLMTFPSGRSFDFGGAAPQMEVYATEPAWDVTDEHLYYAINDDYRIGVHDLAGKLERVITKPFERTPVSENDQSTVLRYIEEAARASGAPPAAIPQIRAMVKFGEYFPAFQSFSPGPRGSLWVQGVRSVAGLTDEELEQYNIIEDQGSPDWDVFDADGRYLGIVTMPARFQPRLITEERVYGVWRDDLDVQYVVRLRILGVPAAE